VARLATCASSRVLSQLGDVADLPTLPTRLAAEVSEPIIDLAQVHLLIDFDIPLVMPFGIDGALTFFSGLRVLLRSRNARPPAIPARATLAATSGVFAFEATRETALLAAPRPLVAALRPVDFARDFALGLLKRFRFAWLPFEADVVVPRTDALAVPLLCRAEFRFRVAAAFLAAA
jgi:hypothetical protein